ncbi:hypothetical protein [Tardiphaga sp.]|uniref:hypothetical protein n=1 Tax=Tardiphaga sp. TaxID=1926292 RepID=UPI00352BBBC1
MAKAARLRFWVAIGAIVATTLSLLLSQLYFADVIRNEVTSCFRSATPIGVLKEHLGLSWPWLVLLMFQIVGISVSRFFWLSVAAGIVTALHSVGHFDIIFPSGTTAKWECTDWSWYDEMFGERAFAFFVLLPLAILFVVTGAVGLLWRLTGARLIDGAAPCSAGKTPGEANHPSPPSP